MVDVFISYANEDEDRVAPLARALIGRGTSVWWDREIPPGRTFDEVIEEALAEAKAVVVVWTETSVASRWVRTEAAEGAARGILVPALFDDVRIPLAFRRIHAADLIGWEPGEVHAEFEGLLQAIEGLTSVATVDPVELAAGPPSGQADAVEGELLVAMARANAGDWDDVTTLIESLQGEEPDLGDRYPGAVELLALARRQHEVAELFEDAELLYAAGEWSDAVSRLDRILDLDPDTESADRLRTKAQRHLAARREAALTDRYQRGLEALDAEDWPVAVARFEEVVEDAPEFRDAPQRLEQARMGASVEKRYGELRDMRDRGDWEGVAAGIDDLTATSPAFEDREDLVGWVRDRIGRMDDRPAAKAEEPLAETGSKGWLHQKWFVAAGLGAGVTLSFVVLVLAANLGDEDGPEAGNGTSTSLTPPGGTSTSLTPPGGGEGAEPPDDPLVEVSEVIEAETGAILNPMEVLDDAGARGGLYIATSLKWEGSASFDVDVAGGSYVVWARVAAGEPRPTAADSFFVSVDGRPSGIWDFFEELAIPGTLWEWEKISLRCGGDSESHNCDPWLIDLEPGVHTLTFDGRERGSRLDAFLLTTDLEFEPPG